MIGISFQPFFFLFPCLHILLFIDLFTDLFIDLFMKNLVGWVETDEFWNLKTFDSGMGVLPSLLTLIFSRFIEGHLVVACGSF